MPSHQAVGFPVLLVSYWVLGLPLGALWAFKAPRNGLRGLWWGMTLGVWLHFSAFVAICFGHAAASRAPRSRCRVPGAVDWPAAAREAAARLEASRLKPEEEPAASPAAVDAVAAPTSPC